MLCVNPPAETFVAALLQEMLDEHGLRITELQKKTGISRSAMHRHFTAVVLPNLDVREKYARAFGMELEEFEREWKSARQRIGMSEQSASDEQITLPPPSVESRISEVAERLGLSIREVEDRVRGFLDEMEASAAPQAESPEELEPIDPRLHRGTQTPVKRAAKPNPKTPVTHHKSKGANVAKVAAYHTDSPEYEPKHREVYHDRDDCKDGKRIEARHRKSGTGGKRLCDECRRLAQ